MPVFVVPNNAMMIHAGYVSVDDTITHIVYNISDFAHDIAVAVWT